MYYYNCGAPLNMSAELLIAQIKQLRIQLCRSDDGKEIRNQMEILIKSLYDDYKISPRTILGKGNVSAQKKRYKKRVIEEKRFQCPKCEYVFTSSHGLKNHIGKKVCDKEPPKGAIVCPCGGRYKHKHISSHIKTKKHQKYLLN